MSPSMFKMGNFEAELASSMVDHLKHNRLEKTAEISQMHRIVQSGQAIDHLHSAATILDGLGCRAEADVITRLLEKMANKEHHSKEEPVEFEMTSLLHEPDEEEELGDQVIELESLLSDKKKA